MGDVFEASSGTQPGTGPWTPDELAVSGEGGGTSVFATEGAGLGAARGAAFAPPTSMPRMRGFAGGVLYSGGGLLTTMPAMRGFAGGTGGGGLAGIARQSGCCVQQRALQLILALGLEHVTCYNKKRHALII